MRTATGIGGLVRPRPPADECDRVKRFSRSGAFFQFQLSFPPTRPTPLSSTPYALCSPTDQITRNARPPTVVARLGHVPALAHSADHQHTRTRKTAKGHGHRPELARAQTPVGRFPSFSSLSPRLGLLSGLCDGRVAKERKEGGEPSHSERTAPSAFLPSLHRDPSSRFGRCSLLLSFPPPLSCSSS